MSSSERSFLSSIYEGVTSLRNFLFDKKIFKSYQSKLPVISVGNLTVGGNGKTMIVLALCEHFYKLGRKPVVLSRGYKGKIKGPHKVSSEDNFTQVGDEPLMIFRKGRIEDDSNRWNVVVSKDRVAGAKFIEENNLGDLIILDDGFQHRWLERDADIVCVNTSGDGAIEEFKRGELLPAGKFRESKDKALTRATHLLWVPRSPADNFKNISELEKAIPLNVLSAVCLNSVKIRDKHSKNIAYVNVLCGIANPQGFLTSVEGLGVNIVKKFIYPDHQGPSESDIKEMISLPVLCTEKDFVKIPDKYKESFLVVESDLEIPEKVLVSLE